MLIALAWMLITHPPEVPGAAGESWVRTWTDREAPYDHGDPVRVFLRLDRAAYVTVLRVDTDGRIRILYPRSPWGDNHVEERHTFEITGRRDDYAFAVDEEDGAGYVFVIASPQPFDYRDFARDDYWDYRLLSGGRIRGDPYVALTDLAERISGNNEYAYDVTPYYVGRRYDYPRFVCAQCHSHTRDRAWDEYRLRCARFRLVIYDDPAYYPYRYDRGRNVVVERPLHPGPRFVFRNAEPRADYVTRLRGQAAEADRRQARELSPTRPLIERHQLGDQQQREGGNADEDRDGGQRRESPSDGGQDRRRVSPRSGRPDATPSEPRGLAPVPRDEGKDHDSADGKPGRRPSPSSEPQSVGSPELRRRKR